MLGASQGVALPGSAGDSLISLRLSKTGNESADIIPSRGLLITLDNFALSFPGIVKVEVIPGGFENAGTIEMAEQLIALHTDHTSEAFNAPFLRTTMGMIVVDIGSDKVLAADFTVLGIDDHFELVEGESPSLIEPPFSSMALAVVGEPIGPRFVAVLNPALIVHGRN